VSESEAYDPRRFVEDKIWIEGSVVDISGDHPKLILIVVFEMLFDRRPRAKPGAVLVVDPDGGAGELAESITIEPSEVDVVHHGLRIEGFEFRSQLFESLMKPDFLCLDSVFKELLPRL